MNARKIEPAGFSAFRHPHVFITLFYFQFELDWIPLWFGEIIHCLSITFIPSVLSISLGSL